MSGAPVRDLVAIHGFTGSPASFGGLRAELAAPDLEVHAPALLGHGSVGHGSLGHGSLGDSADFVSEVERLARWVSSRVAGPALLVGYSLGGRVAGGLLAHHPELFRGALLVGAHPGLEEESARRARVAADARWVRLLREEGLDPFVDAWGALPLFASQAALPASVRASQDAIRRAHDPAGLARSLEVLGLGRMPPWRGALLAYPGVLSLAVGETDHKFRELLGQLAFARGCDLHVVKGAGHNVLLSRPAEVARLVRELREEVEST